MNTTKQHNPSASDLLRQLSELLDLPFEDQDWGIVNARPDRLGEFIEIYSSSALAPTQKFEMGDLIIASANEALLDGSKSIGDMAPFLRFVRGHQEELATHLSYWISLENDNEYPVAEMLRHAISERST